MHTVTLQIKENKLEEFLIILNNLKEDLIEKFTITNKEEEKYLKSEQFLKDKKKLQERLKKIEEGKAVLYTQEEFERKINGHIKNLRAEYANN